MAVTAPLVITFAPGSTLQREQDRRSDFPIHRNGPPGTFVIVGTTKVSLPTDQVVDAQQVERGVTVSFGGMRFAGVEGGRLTFLRVRDLAPEEQLSPTRSWKMTLEPLWVASAHQGGVQVWPPPAQRTGLCAGCAHGRAVVSSKASTFTLCQRSATDPGFAKYPTLPVLACRGFMSR